MFKQLFEATGTTGKEALIKKLKSKNGKVVDFKYYGMDDYLEVKVKHPVKNMGFLFDYIPGENIKPEYKKYTRYKDD